MHSRARSPDYPKARTIQKTRNDIMQHFDFNETLKAIQAGKPITGSDGVLAPLIKQLTEAALSAEIESYLGQNLNSNNPP